MIVEWQRATALFGAARELDPESRAAFLEAACRDNPELRIAVESLLAGDRADDSFLKVPLLKQPPFEDLAAPGDLLNNRYRIERRMATGGQAVIYNAVDTALARQVVVKVMRAGGPQTPSLRKRFELERTALAKIDHPGIVGIHDVGHLPDGSPYLVIQHIPGVSLRDALSYGRLSADRTANILRQLGAALTVAHAAGVAHLDLKPENIMLQERPDGSEGVKLIDFGIARIAKGDGQDLFATALIAGTVRYMAPEQFQGDNSAASDVYALALIACEMLTGIADLREPLTKNRRVSRLIEAALARDPAARPADVRLWSERLASQILCRRAGALRSAILDFTRAMFFRERLESGEPLLSPPRLWLMGVAASTFLLLGVISNEFGNTPEARWSATRLGGSNVALAPRVSPDGRLIAFIAMVDGMTQVAVMKQESGNWTTLTRDRSRGNVGEISWSLDGTKLYFDRADGAPRGIYSVPVLGGEERLVMEDATTPEVLGDGSLVAVRINAARNAQPHRLWPKSGRIEPLNVVLSTTLQNSVMMRATTRAEKLMFWGRPLQESNAPQHLYVLDLQSQELRRLAPELSFPSNPRYLPFAISPDGRFAYFDAPSGDLHRIVRATTDGSSTLETLFSVPTTTAFMDVAADGSVYVDQWERPFDVIRFSQGGRKPEYIATATGPTLGVVPLPDGRVVYESHRAEWRHLVVAGVGRPAVPFVETQDETRLPVAVLNGSEVAISIGSGDARTIAVASMSDGRVVRRLTGSKGAEVSAMVAATDGATIYYSASGTVWAISSHDGTPRKVRSGDAVTMDPYKQELIVSLFEKQGVRLIRVPLNGAPERTMDIAGQIGLAPSPLSPTAVNADGEILVRAVPPGSWFYPTGLLDPTTRQIELVPIGYDADMGFAGWVPDNEIVAVAAPLRSSLWMFRPAPGAQ